MASLQATVYVHKHVHYCSDSRLPGPPQAKDIKTAADLVSQVRRAGPGHGTLHIDVLLQHKYGAGGGDGFGENGALLAG